MISHIFAFFQLIPVLIAATLSVNLWKNRGNMRDRKGYLFVAIIQAGLALSSLAYGVELVTSELNGKMACVFFRYLGSYMMLLGTLFFALWYTGKRQWLTWPRAFFIGLPACLSLAAIATNNLYHFYYPAIWLIQGLDVPQLAHSVSPFYSLIMVYALCLIFITLYIFISCQLTTTRVYVPGIALVTGGYFIMVMGYVLYLSGFRPFGFMNLTYYFSTINIIALTTAVLRYGVHMVRPLRYNALIRNLPIGVIMFDRDMHVGEINPTARRMLSLGNMEPMQGKHLPDIPLHGQKILNFCAIQEAGVMETNLNGLNLSCTVSEIRDHLNEVAGKLLLLQDITVHKQLEEQLLNINSDLQKRVEEETERRLVHERLMANQARMAAMGKMIGAIAHQWRQPLSTLSMIIQLLHAVGIKKELTREKLDEFKAGSMRQIQYMSDTIDEFRDFYRQEKQRELFQPHAIVADAIRLFSPLFTSKNIAAEMVCQEDSQRSVSGYRNEFKQVILNLLGNARDAIINCRALHGEPEKGRIFVNISINSKNIMIIDISDNGIGIPEDIVDQIFNPYFTTKEDSGGTGIGLYMSRMIMEDSLKGSLSLLQCTEGAVFRIELPMEEA